MIYTTYIVKTSRDQFQLHVLTNSCFPTSLANNCSIARGFWLNSTAAWSGSWHKSVPIPFTGEGSKYLNTCIYSGNDISLWQHRRREEHGNLEVLSSINKTQKRGGTIKRLCRIFHIHASRGVCTYYSTRYMHTNSDSTKERRGQADLGEKRAFSIPPLPSFHQ